MKKIYLQPELNVVEIKMQETILDTSVIHQQKEDVPEEYDDEGVDNGWGEWQF